MANPTSLHRPPDGHRYDPTALDATGATLGDVLTAVSDGSGGKRAGYAPVGSVGSGVTSFNTRTGAVVAASADYTIAQIAGLASVAANTILAGPTSGGSAAAAMRALVAADIPSLDTAKITTGVFGIARIATGTPDGTKFVRDDGVLAVPPGTGTYTDEQAQDAVGAMVDGTLVYVDATPLLTRAALTGDVTAAQASNALTIANDAVTYAKMQNVSAASKLLGRGDSGSGDPQEITLGANLTMTGTTLAATGGVSDGDKGDITVSASGATFTIDNDVVTFAKMQNIATARLLGRTTASSGDVEEIAVGSNLTLTGGVLDTGAGGTVPDWARYDPLTPPAGYNATVSDTFPGSSLDGKWTKTGAITLVTVVNGGLLITGGTSGSFQVGLIEQTAPSTPYVITAVMQHASLATLQIIGPYVRESSGGKFWAANMYKNSGAWTDLSAVVSRYASPTSRTSIAGNGAIGWPSWFWVRLANDGTNLTASYSVEGRYWVDYFTETIAASNLNGTTIDKIGIMVDNFGTTAGHMVVRAFIVT